MANILTATDDISYEEWLNFRNQGIGGSDVSVVCGINKYKSAVELCLEKTGQIPHSEANEAAYWGAQLEPFVKAEFTKRTGIEIREIKQILQSEEYPFMLANLDGVCCNADHGNCIFEAKTASAYKIGEWENTIPDEYMLQIQHYMAVTGFNGAYIAVLIGGNTFKWKFVEREDELISMIIRLESEFREHVQNRTPPPIDGSDACAKYLAEKYSECNSSIIELPQNAVDIIRQYNADCEQLKLLSESKQKSENLLKEILGENETGTVDGNVVAWKNVVQERFDGKRLKADDPDLYEKYLRKTLYRRFTIKSDSEVSNEQHKTQRTA